jgi:hypothetical protein
MGEIVPMLEKLPITFSVSHGDSDRVGLTPEDRAILEGRLTRLYAAIAARNPKEGTFVGSGLINPDAAIPVLERAYRDYLVFNPATSTVEEQRYATAWAKLRSFEKFARWVMAGLVLTMVALLLGPKSLSDSFGIVFLVFAVVAGLGGHYFTVTFKCPRCQRQFQRMWRFQHKTNCHTCGLPRFTPRNPNPTWRPN